MTPDKCPYCGKSVFYLDVHIAKKHTGGSVKKRTSPEHDEQVALFKWAAVMANEHPVLGLLYAIPNGARTTMRTAVKLKAEGLRAGFPDIGLPVPVTTISHELSTLRPTTGRVGIDILYHDYPGHKNGLFIEMKAGKGKQQPHQKFWQACLEQQGYAYVVCHSWVEAAKAICDYLGIEPEGL